MSHICATGTAVFEDDDIIEPQVRPILNPNCLTLEKHIQLGRREMGEQRWAELNREWL